MQSVQASCIIWWSALNKNGGNAGLKVCLNKEEKVNVDSRSSAKATRAAAMHS